MKSLIIESGLTEGRYKIIDCSLTAALAKILNFEGDISPKSGQSAVEVLLRASGEGVCRKYQYLLDSLDKIGNGFRDRHGTYHILWENAHPEFTVSRLSNLERTTATLPFGKRCELMTNEATKLLAYA